MTLYKWSQSQGSNAGADATINWAEGQAPSTVNDSARAMMAATAKWRDDITGVNVTSGTSTAYSLPSNQGITANTDNFTVQFTPGTTNTGAVTLSVDSQLAKPIRAKTGVDLAANSLQSGSVYTVTYRAATQEWLLHNQVFALPANIVVTASISDVNVTYAKIQNVAASRLLGNPTGSPAAPSEISLAGGLSFSGTTLKSAGIAMTSQRFTSGSGTYTTPAGCVAIRVRMVGGGGGGGGGNSPTPGTGGGITTFSTFAANGGVAGVGTGGSGGSGGTASGGNILNIQGGSGGNSSSVVGTAGAPGGNSVFGSGGLGALSGSSNGGGSAGPNSGGGGGGGSGGSSNGGAGSGGAGGYVEAIITSPASTYSYAVGAGGPGASAAAPGGGGGGAGGAGIIIVEEYY